MCHTLTRCARFLRAIGTIGAESSNLRGHMGLQKLALIATTFIAVQASLLSAQACKPADAVSKTVLGDLTSIATGTDSMSNATRTLNKIPASSSVSYVTTTTTCQKAVTALNTMFHTTGASRQLYVFAIGSSFIAIDPTLPTSQGGPDAEFVFDKKWVLQAARVSD